MRSRLRYSLRLLILATAIVAVVSAWAVMLQRRGERQRQAETAAENISGFVDLYYAYEVDWAAGDFPEMKKAPAPLPAFCYQVFDEQSLHRYVGLEVALPDDWVQALLPLAELVPLKVIYVSFDRYMDDEMQHFQQFKQLEYLHLKMASNLTDAGLPHLAKLRQLKVLKISGDRITEQGIEDLRRRMPWCEINYYQLGSN